MFIIHEFSRKEALETGELIDVSTLAKEAGVKFPVAVTSTIWQGVIVPDESAKENGESTDGRLWDVLYLFTLAASKSSGSVMYFSVNCTEAGESKKINLKAVIGPGDDLAPVITIMDPSED